MTTDDDDRPELTAIFERIRKLERSARAEAEAPPADVDHGRRARLLYDGRARIGRYFDAKLFGDPAFDILLDLFASEEQGVVVDVTACMIAARVPTSTALRYIAALERGGIITRTSATDDRRRHVVHFTPAGRAAMVAYLRDSFPAGAVGGG